jgi:3-methyladenine DNA glycosylase AlkD
MTDFISTLTHEFTQNINTQIALKQKVYLRNQFEFYGIKTERRRAIQKPFLAKQYLPAKETLIQIVTALWQKPQREFQYYAQELVLKYIKDFEKKDVELLEYMVTHKSWWDTVDFIATKLLGPYFKLYPDQQRVYVQKWIASDNIWLQRAALLFQLKYKENLDTHVLISVIIPLLASKEFFINKAIGWVLREYSKTDPAWVIDFVSKTDLNALSRKEALSVLNNRNRTTY